jgi:hypothetical protein
LRILHIFTVSYDRVRWLHEEKWWLTIGIMAHFTSMVGIVSANAINPVHSKTTSITYYWQ